MRRCISLLWIIMLGLALSTGGAPARAQDDLPLVEAAQVVETTGVFGQAQWVARGRVRNDSESAFTDLSLRAEVYDAADTLIGEGVGVAVNACGAGWLPGFALQPGAITQFDVPLELFEMDAEIERVDIFVSSLPTEALVTDPLPDGFRRAADDEVIEVEWTSAVNLRYAVGCERQPFTEWAWANYNNRFNTRAAIVHPRAADVTEAMRTRLQAMTPEEYAHAFVRYAPDGDRFIFQNRINDFLSAAPDGRFQRALHIALHNRTLQGIYWQPDEVFLAYYFGGYGDSVLYFTGTAEARRISLGPERTPPSLIVPGISRDARRAVIAGNFDERGNSKALDDATGLGVGYYLTVLDDTFFEKLFDAELPGNNYPSPLVFTNPEDNLVNRIYVALDDAEGDPRLMCFNRDEGELYDLAPLPFRLAEDERAQWWLSPDDNTIALAANGVHGGMWLIDVTMLPVCTAE